MAGNPGTVRFRHGTGDEKAAGYSRAFSFPIPEADADLVGAWSVNPRHAVVPLGVRWRYMARSEALFMSQPGGLAGSPNACTRVCTVAVSVASVAAAQLNAIATAASKACVTSRRGWLHAGCP